MTTSHTTHHIHPSTTDTTESTPATARRGSGIGRKTAGFLAAAALAGTLTACAGGGTYEVMPEAKAGTDCSEPLLDLSSTRLGYHMQQQRVATDYSSTWFHFTVADNQFDPCKPLSWVVLEGENSDVNGQQGGTGSSAAQAVVFFHYDQMITEPASMQFHDATVERTGDDSAHVDYGFVGGATAGGVTDRITVDYSMSEDGHLRGEHLIPDFVDGLRLNFNQALPPGTATVSPYGNALFTPWDYQLEGGMARVPLGDELLECEFGGPQAVDLSAATCISHGKVLFPHVNSLQPDMPRTMDMKNSVYMTFAPPAGIMTGRSAGLNKSIEQTIEDEAITRVGQFLVDTHGDEVRVTSNGIMYSFSNGKAEKLEGDVNIPEIDKERWPAPDELTPYPEQP